jgi:hypothetical protein
MATCLYFLSDSIVNTHLMKAHSPDGAKKIIDHLMNTLHQAEEALEDLKNNYVHEIKDVEYENFEIIFN